MIRFLIVSLVLGGAILFILNELVKFFGGISGTRSSVQGDFQELQAIVDGYELSPWSPEELDLISRDHHAESKSAMFSYIEYGYFESIFQEPIMAFATKEYNNNSRRLSVVKFNDKKYLFNEFEGKVALQRPDHKILGKVSIEEGVKIKLGRNQSNIRSYADAGLIPLSIDNKHILGIATDDELTGSGGRMLRKINDHNPGHSELIQLSVAFALANKQI